MLQRALCLKTSKVLAGLDVFSIRGRAGYAGAYSARFRGLARDVVECKGLRLSSRAGQSCRNQVTPLNVVLLDILILSTIPHWIDGESVEAIEKCDPHGAAAEPERVLAERQWIDLPKLSENWGRRPGRCPAQEHGRPVNHGVMLTGECESSIPENAGCGPNPDGCTRCPDWRLPNQRISLPPGIALTL
jgi:hypothetical protein